MILMILFPIQPKQTRTVRLRVMMDGAWEYCSQFSRASHSPLCPTLFFVVSSRMFQTLLYNKLCIKKNLQHLHHAQQHPGTRKRSLSTPMENSTVRFAFVPPQS